MDGVVTKRAFFRVWKYFGFFRAARLLLSSNRTALKILLTTVIFLAFASPEKTDARYYSSVKCKSYGGYAKGGTVKLGMGLYEVVKICGPPVRKMRHYIQNETRTFPGMAPSAIRQETAVYRHFLWKREEWKKSKIFRFRNLKLYQIYDYGTLSSTDRRCYP